MHPMLNTAIKAARRGAAVINRASFDLDRVTVTEKQHHDFVTDIDQAAEQADNDVTGSNSNVQRSNARKMRALSGSLPRPSPAAAMPAPMSPRRPSPPKGELPAAVREAHDEAMQHLQ